MATTTSLIIATLPATALALGLASGLARAEGSDGMGMEALVAAIPRDGTGWSNGPASLSPQGGGEYRLDYDAALAHGGVGVPGGAVIVGNDDGNPVIAHGPMAPVRRRALASRLVR